MPESLFALAAKAKESVGGYVDTLRSLAILAGFEWIAPGVSASIDLFSQAGVACLAGRVVSHFTSGNDDPLVSPHEFYDLTILNRHCLRRNGGALMGAFV